MTDASREMESGAALRASTISEFRSSIRYCSRGAMLGYAVLASCATACNEAPNMQPSTITATTHVFSLCIIFTPTDFSLNCLISTYITDPFQDLLISISFGYRMVTKPTFE